jgi:hypothetical protein
MNDEPTPMTAIHAGELARLQSCEQAWGACFETLKKGNPRTFIQQETAILCAVHEIERLQKAVATLTTRVAETREALLWHYQKGHSSEVTGVRMKIDEAVLRRAHETLIAVKEGTPL